MSILGIIRQVQTSLPVDKNKCVNPSHSEMRAMGPD